MKISAASIAVAALVLSMLTGARVFADDMSGMNMGTEGHGVHPPQRYTSQRPKNDADQKRVDLLAATLRDSLARYKDFHRAEAAGFKPFHPEHARDLVHFTRAWYAIKAAFTFNPADPTSLLYRKTPEAATKPRRTATLPAAFSIPNSSAGWST